MDGQAVEGLWLHFVGGPVHLIAPGDGTFEFERLYYTEGKYAAKAGYDGRIGGEIILGADMNDERLVITTTHYSIRVPMNRVSGNWLTPGNSMPPNTTKPAF